ncbi:TlyA family RNA methyltransferase [Aquibacillus sp. 3ASR75-11]|uniref:TlyA family RNA methyltransferase n=1 Tax=Terrihalobacillus insolitus TaxID=2950438 RepID=A0A9X4AP95_9BACI|nr:TlyA family RNA methyltransferase [Terrihalobacillus insolitus]MDC3414440.1 TlyA family RNA methyltransferase [Terrihalobacillus insolitus]MDC3425320.1 TlyA family RNA methyltransferase [Terrihalobacillus insolitus]
MVKKQRLDLLLVDRHLIDTREKAKRAIMAGLVYSEQHRLDKPGMKVNHDIPLQIKGKLIPYVGRGGLKLEKAVDIFQLYLKDKIMIDVGSSTGGFTDCGLQKGVKRSYAVDVGYNQLDWKLRSDPRVVVMERTNFRYVTADMLTEGLPNFASVDVSFISLTLIIPVLSQLLCPNSDVVVLIKPQFEAGKASVGKNGIVRDQATHTKVLERILDFSVEKGFVVKGLTFSPITGGEGNIEFLAHLFWSGDKEGKIDVDVEISSIVKQAHQTHYK